MPFLPHTALLLVVAWGGAACVLAQSSPTVSAIHLSADAAIEAVWINGQAQTLGANAANWKQADTYTPGTPLQSLAVQAVAGTGLGRAGLIGHVLLSTGVWVPTDRTWKTWIGGSAPPADASGRAWHEPGYDDSDWAFATELGPYGCGPWGTDTSAPGGVSATGTTPTAQLDATMRQTGPYNGPVDAAHQFLINFGGASRHRWNANWIWGGTALGGLNRVYARKSFLSQPGLPPTRPQDLEVTAVNSTSFSLAWQPSYSPQGIAYYEVAWNGLVRTTTTGLTATLSGLTLNPEPQNYAWVRAISSDGTPSLQSPFVLVAPMDTVSPGPVSNLHIVQTFSDGFTLGWEPAADDVAVKSYSVRVGTTAFSTPAGVCQGIFRQSTFLQPATSYTITVKALDANDNEGPSRSLQAFTLPASPAAIAAPIGISISNGTVSWSATPSATSYRLWRDGREVAGTITTTSAAVPSGAAHGFVQVTARDAAGNESARSTCALVGTPPAPAAPNLQSLGRDSPTLALRWTQPATGTCQGYRLERLNGTTWSTVATFPDPRIVRHLVSNLSSTTAYTARVVALHPDGSETPGPSLTVPAIPADSPSPLLQFAVILATDGQLTSLTPAMDDAVAAGCSFVIIKGQLAGQAITSQTPWNNFQAALAPYTLPILVSPLSVKDTWTYLNDYTSSWAGDEWGEGVPVSNARLDLGAWKVGYPLNQLATFLGGRLRIASTAENPRNNPEGPGLLETWLHQTEALGEECDWLITTGMTPEARSQGIGRVMQELWRPVVEIMRSTNGNPGHELLWEPGSNLATLSPQRNRARGHYLVRVEPDRLILEARLRNATTGIFSTSGKVYLHYHRQSNTLSPGICRIPYGNDRMHIGLPEEVNHRAAWTHNRILRTIAGAPLAVQLLGRSPRSTPLTYSIIQSPTHGTLTGTGPTRTYTPTPTFVGDDVFLYRANDNGPWPANTAWVKISVTPAPSFTSWASLRYPGLSGGPNQDDDHDGLANAVEFAFDLHPLSPTPATLIPHPTLTDEAVLYHFSSPATIAGVTYAIQWSTDLVQWHDATDTGSGNSHTFVISRQNHPRLFTRHLIVLQP